MDKSHVDAATAARMSGMPSALDTADAVTREVAARVQDHLRAEQIDPSRDPARAKQLVTVEVRRHNDFAPARGDALILDEDVVTREVLAVIAGLGPLQHLLEDPSVEEIWINAELRKSTWATRLGHA